MTIDALCRVVDNYGDIGVVYRLIRALSAIDPRLKLRIVVDGLEAFHRIEPAIDPDAPIQSIRGWTVYRWDEPDAEAAAARDAEYLSDPPRAVLECFACGRPEWLEAILFDDAKGLPSTIVNVEYLSAEGYAEELHLAQSLTRSPTVRKRMFMPGFTPKTGGLIIDAPFAEALSARADRRALVEAREALLAELGLEARREVAALSWVALFSYPRDYSRIVADLAEAASRRPLAAFAAAGVSQECAVRAWERAGRPFPLYSLPFLHQERWDRLVAYSDFSVVRGEDSMTRAAIAGAPFVWHAYPQEGRHQLVKVGALLKRMRPHFEGDSFAPIAKAFIELNDRDADGPEVAGLESILSLVEADSACERGFASFAESLRANGDMASHLMTFLREIV